MARYIDADAFLDKFNKALESQQHYGFYNHAKITQYVMKAIENEPTADVVPKSEVDQWYNEYHSIKDELKREKMEHNATEKLADRYCVELQTAKSEVAREFAEEVKLEFYREFDEIIPSIMADKIDDLVKKYTEEK